MSIGEISAIDFVRELRLRQWARTHYVSGEDRKSTWHPIVLDEMSLRDRELAEEGVLNSSNNVPLEVTTQSICPLPIPQDAEWGLHQNPVPDWSQPGLAYVPLAPSGNWRFDTAEARLPKPHFGASFVTRSEGRSIAELTALR